LHLITIDKETRNRFFEFLVTSLQNGNSLTQKITIVDRFIHQIQFLITDSKGAIKTEIEQEYKVFKSKFSELIYPLLNNSNKYFHLLYKSLNPDYQLIKFEGVYEKEFLSESKSIPLVQQIKLRNINEKIGFYNVCFNHLLNEFQNLFEMVLLGGKQVTAKDIRDKMAEDEFLTSEIKFVTEFFDRRNQNSISHTNEQEIGFWGVGQIEYEEYKRNIFPVIRKVYIKRNE